MEQDWTEQDYEDFQQEYESWLDERQKESEHDEQ